MAPAGRDEEARADLDRAPEPDRDLAEAWFLRAGVRDRNGDPEGAYEDLDTVLAIDPDHVGALLARAGADFTAGRYEAALTDLDRALFETDDPSAVLGLRGRVLHGLGRTAEALEDLARAVELDPSAERIVLEPAGLHPAEDRPLGALAPLVRDTGSTDGHGEALLLRARAQLIPGDTAAALADIERAAALGERAGARAVLADPALAAVPEARVLSHGLTDASGGSGT
ncbi:hypothetical protein B7R87_12600 [Streptomyces tsukubensis]|nr:hypothetical protein B7R87_12600 [Streptomyces tsukubensis]EIF90414.1 Tetratricopeptide TPR_1 repeat-containing protein [Streptomyces tsukubensis NRRL18488]